MSPADVAAYISELERWGLQYLKNGKAKDLVCVDQQRGHMVQCDWAKCGKTNWGNDPRKRITYCNMVDSKCDQLLTPEGWTYEGSLSESFGFVPLGAEHTLELINEEDGLMTLRGPLSDQPLYIGRTHSKATQRSNFVGWRRVHRKE